MTGLARALLWVGLTIGGLGAVIAIAGAVEGEGDAGQIVRALGHLAPAAMLLPIGALMLSNAPGHPLGPIMAAAGFGGLVSGAAEEYAFYSHEVRRLPAAEWVGWVSEWAAVPGLLIPAVGLLLFPDGRPLSRRWGWWVWAGYSGALLVGLLGFLGPGDNLDSSRNPLMGEAAEGEQIEALGMGWFLLLGATAAGVVSLVKRRRTAGEETREQIAVVTRAAKWVLSALVVCTVLAFAVPALDDLGSAAFVASMALLAAAMGVAILRHRLLGLDVYVNRAAVAGGTAVVLGAAYTLLVLAAGAALDEDPSLGVALPATALVAVALVPVRDRIQLAVDRLLHGERADPYAAITALGERLDAAGEQGQVLPALVATIVDALRLPYAAIELRDGAVVAHGTPAAGVALRLPLVHAGRPVGTMLVGARAHGEPLGPADVALLEQFARSAAAAANAAALSVEVQRSRERLITAREEERRRLHSDLHDGLAPTLAGAVLTIDAARRLMNSDPAAADALLDRAAASVEGTVADVRRVVYALRPPALDQLALVGALRQHALMLSTGAADLDCDVIAPEPFPHLPAATEVAAFRIAQEALTNVVRHAHARHATVTLAVDGALTLEVRDDGTGLPADRTPGVGLESMRERALELGGTFTLDTAPRGGTRVHVTLPL